MKPVRQIRTGYGKGQCTEACVASLLEIELEAVPDLWAGPDIPADAPADIHQPEENRRRLWEWVRREHNLMFCAFTPKEPRQRIKTVWELAAMHMPSFFFTESWASYHMAGGHNPDGILHYVIAHRGQERWDPNPRRRGIVDCDSLVWLVPPSVLPEHVQAFPAAEWKEQ